MGILDAPVIQRETLGAKLRRLARTADISNPIINPPWTIPAAWAPSTVYNTLGMMVSNLGSWYTLVTTGTSAGSGGPNNTGTGTGIADNTCAWTYAGGPTIAASDANAPTFSTGTGTPGGLSHYINALQYPNRFRVYGGVPVTVSVNYWNIVAFSQKAGQAVSFGASIGFETDAPKFAVGFTNNAPDGARIAIDGRYYSPGALTPATGGTPTWMTFDFGSTSARRTRKVLVDGPKSNNFNFAGARVDNSSSVWAPPTQDDVRAVFISDSIWAGSAYGPVLCGANIPGRVGKMLGWSDCWNLSVGGTGYVQASASNFYTYPQRIPEALTLNPDLWLFMGSTNDNGLSGIQAAALSAFQQIRAGGSTAPIIVFGVWPLNAAGVATSEAAVQAAVTQFADPLGKTFFIPLYADPDLPWITGAWNNTADTSSTNATMYIAGDSTHPADIGTAYLAARMVRAIRTLVLPFLR